jgi:transcriptional regulator with XRE-family HTH domain
MKDELSSAVRRAIDRAPCSTNALAEAAGVPQSTLSRIQSGERSATPAVAQAVVEALEAWGEECLEAAKALRRVARRRKPR